MAKLVEYITPTWIPEEEDKYIPIYDPSIDGERIELVRCKDCAYYRNNPVAPCTHVLRCEDADENWFCAEGKKKVATHE